MHIFLGMLLIGPVALKLASTGYRFARYYTHGPEYVREGPPVPLMRFLVAPVLVFSTLTLFGTGVALLLVPHRGPVLMLHKASFIVWFGATSIHVLVYALRSGQRLLAELRGDRPAGGHLRLAAVFLALAGGAVLAFATYPLAHPWLHSHGFPSAADAQSGRRRRIASLPVRGRNACAASCVSRQCIGTVTRPGSRR